MKQLVTNFQFDDGSKLVIIFSSQVELTHYVNSNPNIIAYAVSFIPLFNSNTLTTNETIDKI